MLIFIESDLFSVITAIIAIYAAFFTTLAFFRDRACVKVKVNKGYHFWHSGKISKLIVTIEAINKGRRPVTMSSSGFLLKGDMKLSLIKTDLPREITEGKSHQEDITLKELKEALKDQDYEGAPQYAYFKDQTGREYKQKMRKKHWASFF